MEGIQKPNPSLNHSDHLDPNLYPYGHLSIESLVNDSNDFITEEYLDLSVLDEEFQPSPDIVQKYLDTSNSEVLRNIEIQTKVKQDMIASGYSEPFTKEIEYYRRFPDGALACKGIFFMENQATLLKDFPDMANTSMYKITNGANIERYVFPICLPNGDVFTYLYYQPKLAEDGNGGTRKYMFGDLEWIHSGNLFGNMESLSEYPDERIVYICEGLIDAYRLSNLYRTPTFALLGSILTTVKLAILKLLEKEGYQFIYVPDNDETGKKTSLIENPVFSRILHVQQEYKDVDDMARDYYESFLLDNKVRFGITDVKRAVLTVLSKEEVNSINQNIKDKMHYSMDLPTYCKIHTNELNNIIKTGVKGYISSFNKT